VKSIMTAKRFAHKLAQRAFGGAKKTAPRSFTDKAVLGQPDDSDDGRSSGAKADGGGGGGGSEAAGSVRKSTAF
jgi:hypothetical protein